MAKVRIPEPHKEKIGPKTKDNVFIGYAQNSLPIGAKFWRLTP